MKFKYLLHTGDVKFRAYGKNLKEAFKSAALATAEIMTNTKEIQPKIKKQISIRDHDLKSLLYKFIEEILFLYNTKGFLINKIKEVRLDQEEFGLEATLIGDKNKNYIIKKQIKSVTYNDMEIKKIRDKVMIQIVLDI